MTASERSIRDIKKQVECICNSSEFRSKKRLCQFLEFIVDETLAGRGENLKGYTIGTSVFKRDKKFDPEHDPIVRIEAGRLRRSLEVYYLSEGKDDPLQVFIPRGTYIPRFLPNVDRQSSPKQEIIKNSDADGNLSDLPSITVLPFENLTGDPTRDFFVQGFSEELTQELTHFEDFRIIAFHANPGYRNNISPAQVAKNKTNPDFIIEGKVRESENQIKISVKLTDPKKDEHIWGEQFNRELTTTDLIGVQEEIARKVITAIAGEYGIISQRLSRDSRQKQTTELSVYESILRYYYFQSQQTPESAQMAFQALQNAIQKDPDCATAIAMLASLYGNTYMLDGPGSETALPQMIELSNRAIKLDPDNQLVRLVFAWSQFVLNKKEQFFIEIEKTLRLNPNSPVRLGATGFFVSLYGDWERGKRLMDRAMKQSIGYPKWYHGATTLYYYRNKDYTSAHQEAMQYDTPGLFWGPMLRTISLAQLKRSEATGQEIEHLLKLKPDFIKKARMLIERYVKEEALVEHVIEGLKKAGLRT